MDVNSHNKLRKLYFSFASQKGRSWSEKMQLIIQIYADFKDYAMGFPESLRLCLHLLQPLQLDLHNLEQVCTGLYIITGKKNMKWIFLTF